MEAEHSGNDTASLLRGRGIGLVTRIGRGRPERMEERRQNYAMVPREANSSGNCLRLQRSDAPKNDSVVPDSPCALLPVRGQQPSRRPPPGFARRVERSVHGCRHRLLLGDVLLWPAGPCVLQKVRCKARPNVPGALRAELCNLGKCSRLGHCRRTRLLRYLSRPAAHSLLWAAGSREACGHFAGSVRRIGGSTAAVGPDRCGRRPSSTAIDGAGSHGHPPTGDLDRLHQ